MMYPTTSEEVKEWLSRGKYAAERKMVLIERKHSAYLKIVSITRQVEKRIARGTPSRGDDVLASYAAYTAEIDAEIAEHNKTLTETSNAIRGVDGLLHRTVLVGKYVTLDTKEKIADDICRSIRSVDRIHNEAVLKLLDRFMRSHEEKQRVSACDKAQQSVGVAVNY